MEHQPYSSGGQIRSADVEGLTSDGGHRNAETPSPQPACREVGEVYSYAREFHKFAANNFCSDLTDDSIGPAGSGHGCGAAQGRNPSTRKPGASPSVTAPATRRTVLDQAIILRLPGSAIPVRLP